MRPAVVVLILLAVAPALGAQTDADAVVRLGTHLEAVRAEARTQRWLAGGLALGAGALTASAGVSSALLVPVADGGYADSWRNAQLVNAAVWGGLYGGLGLLILNLPGDAETLPDRFDRMSASGPDELRLKRLSGEVSLRSLADQGRTARLWAFGLWGLAGGGLVALTAVSWGDSVWTPAPAANPLFYVGAGCLGTAALNLLLETGPERELRAYRQAGFLSRSDR